MAYAAHVLSAQLQSVDSLRFEEFIAGLVSEQHPDAVHVGAADGGVDVWVPSRRWGLQCKRYSGRIGWAKCEASLKKAQATYELKRYTFVFTADLSGPDQLTFDERLGGPMVDHWGVTQIRNLLEQYPQWETLLGGPGSVRAEADIERPERSVWFTGRGRDLAAIEGRVRGDGVAVIHGLGGVGKTELAAAWLALEAEKGSRCWWLVASDAEALWASARRVGRDLDLPAADLRDDRVVTAVVESLHARNARWSLVLDDAVQPLDAAPFLCPSANGRVLVTSLNPHWRSVGIDAMELGSLESGAAARLLANRSGRSQDEHLEDLASEDLGGLPLALVQVGAYLEQRPIISAGAYRAAFADRAAELLAHGENRASDHTVATVWSLSMEQAVEIEPLARDLLALVAYLAPAPIPVSLFRAPGAGALSDESALADAVAALSSFSLLSVDAEQLNLRVHRLVQTITRSQDSPLVHDALEGVAELVWEALPERMGDHEAVPLMRPLVDHVLAVADRLADREAGRLMSSDLLSAAGNFARITGRFRLAKELFARAVDVADASPEDIPSRDEARAGFLNNYASICAETGDYGPAVSARLQALEIRERVLGVDHELTIKVVANLAGLLSDLGLPDEALPLARRVWEQRRDGPPELRAWGAYNLAETLLSAGEQKEALEFADEAVRIFSGLEGGSRGNLAWGLELRSAAFLADDRLDQADGDAHKALQIRQAAGEGHVDVARAWLACARVSLRRNDVARGSFEAQRVLDLTNGHVEDDHPDRQSAVRIREALEKTTP